MAITKFRQIRDDLKSAIEQGRYKPGERLPSEAALVSEFKTSRPTVIRALRELQSLGLIDRRAGSGTFVRKSSSSTEKTFGLLVPSLADGEIFEPICSALAKESHARGCSLLWGDLANSPLHSSEGSTLRLRDSYIHARVDGVFFSPIEFSETGSSVSKAIAKSLEEAGIAVVLLDRDFLTAPYRSHYDLVCTDNFHVGYELTKHLLDNGSRRIQFLCRPGSADTIRERAYGFQAAMQEAGVQPQVIKVHIEDASNVRQISKLLRVHKPDAMICGNDKTAATFIQSLYSLGLKVPDDLKVVGVDDLSFARLLSPALTTMHQPCQLIAKVAFHAMMERISNPDLPPRTIQIQSKLIVRHSSKSLT